MTNSKWRSIVLAAISLVAFVAPAKSEYALKDGDTVVFLGDSITAARTYGKIIENYTLLRFPGRNVRFINSGWGGDTAAGGAARLERDVFAHEATVLIVAYGTNDIGWGVYADEEHKQKYLNAVRTIARECRQRKVRLYLCSAAVTALDPNTSEESFLQKMCDEGMQLARDEGEHAIDVQRTMRDIQKRVWRYNAALKGDKGKTTMHAADGAHLNDLGHLAMAYAILKGLDAPADVSAVTIDAREPKLITASGCRVTELRKNADAIEFVRLDEGRPINFGLFGALNFLFVPIPNQLNRYLLSVKNLPEGRYEVIADGRLLGRFTERQLAGECNLSSITPNAWEPGGPWDAEATLLTQVTNARTEVQLARMLSGRYLETNANHAAGLVEFDETNRRLETLQRTLTRPVPYRYVIRPAVAETPAK